MQGKSGTLTAKLPEHLSKDDQAYITERVRKWVQKGWHEKEINYNKSKSNS